MAYRIYCYNLHEIMDLQGRSRFLVAKIFSGVPVLKVTFRASDVRF
jgi:hypothetical protein